MMLFKNASPRSITATGELPAAVIKSIVLIRKRTMHHAETLLASFRKLAAFAVFAA